MVKMIFPKNPLNFVLASIDRLALAIISTLTIAILILALGGNLCHQSRCLIHTGPKIRHFSWANQTIRPKDTAFIIDFNRPMDRESVAKNLKITIPDQPDLKDPLPGKISWAGRKMAYTVGAPVPYGNRYRLELEGAQEKFIVHHDRDQYIQPFRAEFQTPDRALAYIGLEGKDRGRLIVYNFTKAERKILTPEGLVVTYFEPYPEGDKILFSATDRRTTGEGLLEQKIYTVTTGIYPQESKASSATTAGKIELVLDNFDYQNLKFDLSADGKIIAVQRVKRKDPSQFGLWLIGEDKKPFPLNNPPGGLFIIAPDNRTIASTQGEGIALLSLTPNTKPLEFFAQFGMVLGFSPDGTKAVMVDFNKNNPDLLYTRSLYLVSNQGTKEKILDTRGSILNCQFTPLGKQMYCLLTELLQGEQYIEQPYMALIDLEKKDKYPLIKLPSYQDIAMSLAPDSLGLLFDRIVTDPKLTDENILKSDAGEAIASGELWLLLTDSASPNAKTPLQLEKLPFVGFQPRWIP